jgi:hypothetical protein
MALALLCGGCARTVWDKPGATAADFERDKLECEYEANKATASLGSSGRGLGNAIGDGIDQGLRNAELATQCMRVRGYSQRAAN